MVHGSWQGTQVRFTLLLLAVFLTIVGVVSLQPFQASSHAPSPVATYSQGLLRVTIPYDALHPGAGQFTVEVLNPEDQVLGRTEQRVEVTARNGHLQSEVKLEKPLAVDDLVWHRVRYRFEYDDAKKPAVEGTESISSILRRPVVHILGQQSVTLKYRLRAKYPIRARTFKSQVYEYYDPEIASVARPVQLEVRKR